MIARVLIKRKIKGGHALDYLIDTKPPKLLSLVEVPIRETKSIGLVVGLKKESKAATKKISRVLTPAPALVQKQIKFAELLAREFLSSLQEVIFSFIPNLNIGDYKKIDTGVKARTGRRSKITLIAGNPIERKMVALENLAGQSLFILPTIEQVDRACELLRKLVSNCKIYPWHSAIKSYEKARVWRALLSGEDTIVVSTRHGLFLPYTNLTRIYIDDPTNFAYHDDQAPYYNAYAAARLAAKIYGADLFVGEAVPDLLSFAAIKNKNITPIWLKNSLEIITKNTFEAELQNPEFVIFIKSSMRSGKISVIGPWRKELKYFCTSCQDIFVSESAVELCPRCKSPKLKLTNFSIESIRDLLATKFSKSEMQKFAIVSLNQLDFLPPHYPLALVPYFNEMEDFPFLNYREKLFRSISSLSAVGAKKAILFGQNLSSNDLAQKLVAGDWEGFLQDELEARKTASLPPFTKAILLVIKSKSKQRNDQIFEKIQNVIASSDAFGRSKAISFEFSPIDDEPGRLYKSKYLCLMKHASFEKFSKIALKIKHSEAHFEVDPVEFV